MQPDKLNKLVKQREIMKRVNQLALLIAIASSTQMHMTGHSALVADALVSLVSSEPLAFFEGTAAFFVAAFFCVFGAWLAEAPARFLRLLPSDRSMSTNAALASATVFSARDWVFFFGAARGFFVCLAASPACTEPESPLSAAISGFVSEFVEIFNGKSTQNLENSSPLNEEIQ